jgi:hypothetical protein
MKKITKSQKSRDTAFSNYHEMLIENYFFSGTKTKMLAEIFCKEFLIFKTKCVSDM